MSTFIVDGNTCFIHSSEFKNIPNVIQKVSVLHGACGYILEQLCKGNCSLVVYVDLQSTDRNIKKKYGGRINIKNLEWPY